MKKRTDKTLVNKPINEQLKDTIQNNKLNDKIMNEELTEQIKDKVNQLNNGLNNNNELSILNNNNNNKTNSSIFQVYEKERDEYNIFKARVRQLLTLIWQILLFRYVLRSFLERNFTIWYRLFKFIIKMLYYFNIFIFLQMILFNIEFILNSNFNLKTLFDLIKGIFSNIKYFYINLFESISKYFSTSHYDIIDSNVNNNINKVDNLISHQIEKIYDQNLNDNDSSDNNKLIIPNNNKISSDINKETFYSLRDLYAKDSETKIIINNKTIVDNNFDKFKDIIENNYDKIKEIIINNYDNIIIVTIILVTGGIFIYIHSEHVLQFWEFIYSLSSQSSQYIYSVCILPLYNFCKNIFTNINIFNDNSDNNISSSDNIDETNPDLTKSNSDIKGKNKEIDIIDGNSSDSNDDIIYFKEEDIYIKDNRSNKNASSSKLIIDNTNNEIASLINLNNNEIINNNNSNDNNSNNDILVSEQFENNLKRKGLNLDTNISKVMKDIEVTSAFKDTAAWDKDLSHNGNESDSSDTTVKAN
jgi:hypothetical protein